MYFLVPFPMTFDTAFDDASIPRAARNGGITKIHYAEYKASFGPRCDFWKLLGVRPCVGYGEQR